MTQERWRVWQLAPDRNVYGDDAGKCIITTADGETEICAVVYREGHAVLMAASPALLDACKLLVGSATPDWCDCREAGERGRCRHMVAAAAIAEAEGRLEDVTR